MKHSLHICQFIDFHLSNPDGLIAVMQFSLLNGSIHDSWLQQGHEGARMDEDIQERCEVLACTRPPPPAEGRKKAPKSTEVCVTLQCIHAIHLLCMSLHACICLCMSVHTC